MSGVVLPGPKSSAKLVEGRDERVPQTIQVDSTGLPIPEGVERSEPTFPPMEVLPEPKVWTQEEALGMHNALSVLVPFTRALWTHVYAEEFASGLSKVAAKRRRNHRIRLMEMGLRMLGTELERAKGKLEPMILPPDQPAAEGSQDAS